VVRGEASDFGKKKLFQRQLLTLFDSRWYMLFDMTRSRRLSRYCFPAFFSSPSMRNDLPILRITMMSPQHTKPSPTEGGFRQKEQPLASIHSNYFWSFPREMWRGASVEDQTFEKHGTAVQAEIEE
jgi:hypothetical protein